MPNNLGMVTNELTDLLRRLSPHEIRDRIAFLAAEEKALQVLLRNSLQLHPEQPGSPTASPTAAPPPGTRGSR